MSRYKYTPEFKAKIVLEVLEGNQEIGEIAADNNLNPNMVRNWKNEFIVLNHIYKAGKRRKLFEQLN